ncbi:MAG: tRNA lysidine(34) synthetase TilS [Peptococcaceae bacterium]|nr:tRNA lysidine(34) synthetase TilS [Peptococcaceae bacterium]
MTKMTRAVELHAQVRRTIARYRLIAPGRSVLVAASGGPDSMALLHVLHDLSPSLGFRLAAVHFNHQTRARESDADQELVEDTARRLGMACFAGRYDVPGAVRPGLNFQAVARGMRYRFFLDTLSQTGADLVALGHHADDQAETVLQNLLRGSGTSGLRGIPPRRGVFIRPLIESRRRDILGFLNGAGLAYREDASNFKTVYNRNRLRLELIPLLESSYNPRVVETLNRLAVVSREDEEYLAGQARLAYAGMASESSTGLSLDLHDFGELPAALAGRVVRIAWEELRGRALDLSYAQVRAVLSLTAGGRTGARLHLPGGVRVTRTYRHLLWARSDEPFGEGVRTRRLVVPGRTPLPEIGLSVSADFTLSPPPWRDLPPTEAVLDYDRTGGDLLVRRRENGDTFWPMGLAGRIKLKKFFIDRKVPRGERDRVPLVGTASDIVWVAGMAPGEPYRVTRDTRRFLRLSLEERI